MPENDPSVGGGAQTREGHMKVKSTCCGETVKTLEWSTNPEYGIPGNTDIPEEGDVIEGFVCESCAGSDFGEVIDVREATEGRYR